MNSSSESQKAPKKALVLAIAGFLLINLAVLSYALEWNDLLIKIPLPLGILALIPAWFSVK